MPQPLSSNLRTRRLATLAALAVVSTTVIALSSTSQDHTAASAAAGPTVTASPTPAVSPSTPNTESPDQDEKGGKHEVATPSKNPAVKLPASASCKGAVKNMTYSAAGGTVTESDSPAPSYLSIQQAEVSRDTNGVTVSYALKAPAPYAGSNVKDANYSTWFGDGDSNNGLITMLYLDSTWFVSVIGYDMETGGDIDAQPTVNGDNVTVRLPLKARTTGGTVDLSQFTHVGWSSSGKDPSGVGTWDDGCPVDGLTAGDPGNWMVRMR
ncbi:hypothetical protein [Streptomyces sp. NPDC002133]|uniref:hypothetical protein n=1 Tax=Streptomyces sp. NPDC002133 TaxID=3154409 RepID=UPI00331E5A7C